MVISEIVEPGLTGRITLQPNRSFSWKENFIVLLSLLFIFLVISLGFSLIGAWVIAPFAVLEFFILFLAFRYVSRALGERELIIIKPHMITVEKKSYKFEHKWSFNRFNIVVVINIQAQNTDIRSISISGDQGMVEIGSFLGAGDQKTLINGLERCGVKLSRNKSYSSSTF